MIYISNLSSLEAGEKAKVRTLYTKGSMRRRLLDIGLIDDTKVECVQKSPSGDPKAYLIRGAVIALRNSDARNIIIERTEGM